ncbi:MULTISPECIES: hypothetical protein [unclassified Acinetobacter]|uniref:hypothetical protein n=1 Tax=unclassified Acinetobacter TaxID=196816 RepID=UPI0035B7A942
MVIEISLLPPTVQQQILAVMQGEIVQFAQDGKIIAQLSQDSIPKHSSKLIGDEQAFGLFKDYEIDGLEYERQVRSEWE